MRHLLIPLTMAAALVCLLRTNEPLLANPPQPQPQSQSQSQSPETLEPQVSKDSSPMDKVSRRPAITSLPMDWRIS